MVKNGPKPRGLAAGTGRGLAAAFALALLGACSLDYGQAMLKELEASLPDLVLYDFTHTVVEGGSPRFRLQAELGESYRREQRMELFGVEFTEFDAQGEDPRINGKACIEIFRNANYRGLFGIEFEGKGDDHEGVVKSKMLLQRYAY